MKSIDECIEWIDAARSSSPQMPNKDDDMVLKSIAYYLRRYSREFTLVPTTYKGKPLGYAEDGFINTYCKPGSFVRDHMVNMNMDDLKQTIEDCRISEDVPTIILDSIDSKVSENLGN